tara:strand:- start:209 stop:415 length:207 start_codon:yes stop_codon:yes gene_type:complete
MKSDVILKIEQSKFETIAPEIRGKFQVLKVEPQDYDEHKDDEVFISLQKQYKKSSKELRDYLFNKRNK